MLLKLKEFGGVSCERGNELSSCIIFLLTEQPSASQERILRGTSYVIVPSPFLP